MTIPNTQHSGAGTEHKEPLLPVTAFTQPAPWLFKTPVERQWHSGTLPLNLLLELKPVDQLFYISHYICLVALVFYTNIMLLIQWAMHINLVLRIPHSLSCPPPCVPSPLPLPLCPECSSASLFQILEREEINKN